MHKLQAVIPDWDLSPHTVIIGGGPASLCFLIHMLRKGRLNDMLKDESFVILDKGDNFGSGHLHEKIVSCNYTGLELTRLIMRDPFYKQQNLTKFTSYFKNLQDVFDILFPPQQQNKNSDTQKIQVPKSNINKKEGLQDQSSQIQQLKKQRTSLLFKNNETYVDLQRAKLFFEDAVIGAFREILSTQTFQELIKYGKDFPPTSLFSYYLRLVGNTLLRYIYNIKQKIVFKPNHFIRQVQFQNDGKFNIRVQIVQSEDEQRTHLSEIDENKTYEPKILENFQNINCKSILVATGQVQTFYSQIQKEIDLDVLKKFKKEQIINSEVFLTDRGCISAFRQINMTYKRKIVIIGDSQDAFACANLLLNGPKFYSYDELEANVQTQFAFKRKSYKCKECFGEEPTKTPPKSQNSTSSPLDNSRSQPKMKDTKSKIQKDAVYEKTKKCRCFGNIDQNNFQWKRVSISKPEFQAGEIVIAHKSEIKINFKNEKEAIDSDYSRFQGYSKNKNDEIHEFSGLKSPLRDLFYDIIEGYEKRVDLEPYKTEEELEKIIGDDTILVINATGLESSDFIIKDLRGNQINLLREESDRIFNVDEFCKLQSEQGSLKSIYGIGDGFALPTTHPMIQSETHKSKIIRAKDWRYYNSVIPDIIIDSYFNSLRSYKEVEKYIQNQEQDFPTDAETFNKKSPQKYYYNSFQSNTDDPSLHMNQRLAQIQKLNKINFQRAENFHKKHKI